MYIVTIHKTNGGVSSARNAGLAIARGEYVTFPDPDDYISDDYISKILAVINKHTNIDMLLFDYKENIDGTIKECKKQYEKGGFIEKNLFLKIFSEDKSINSHVTNKIFKLDLIKNEKFNERIKIVQDFEFCTRIVINFNRIYYLSEVLYFYCSRYNSNTRIMTIDDCIKCFEMAEVRYRMFSKYISNTSIFPMVLWSHKILQLSYAQRKEIDVKKYENFIKNNIITIIKSKEVTFNEKKQCLFVHLGIARIYYKIKNKSS